VHPSGDWADLLGFDLWTPPTEEVMDSYVVHRNDVPGTRPEQEGEGVEQSGG
jgi:hypothetical protein